jgi:hypothetical protein
MAEVFAVAGEKQEMVADEATIALLKRFWGNPDVERGQGRNSGGRKKLKNSSIVDSMGSILPKRWAGSWEHSLFCTKLGCGSQPTLERHSDFRRSNLNRVDFLPEKISG